MTELSNVGSGYASLRHHGAHASMEAFIKHQMMAILQPFADHVQELDTQLTKLAEDLRQTDGNIAMTQKNLEGTNHSVLEMRTGLKKTNARLTTVREGLEKSNVNKEILQAGLENANHNAQRISNSLEGTIAAVQELQRGLREADLDVVGLQVDLKKTNDNLMKAFQSGLDRTNHELLHLSQLHKETCASLEGVKADVERKNTFLQETRQVLEKNMIATAKLEKQVGDFFNKSGGFSTKLEECVGNVTKNTHGLQALEKDVRLLKEGLEANDAASHGLQQQMGSLGQNVTTLMYSHEKWGQDIKSLQQGFAKSNQTLQDTMDGLGKTTSLANTLHSRLQRTDTELHKATLQLESLDLGQHSLQSNFEKAAGNVVDLMRGHRKAVSTVQSLQHELEKTNETVHLTKGTLDSINMDLHEVKGDLGRTNDIVQKLDLGVEFCHAGFTGLRKGFQETGTHIQTHPHILPKLNMPGSDVKPSKELLGPKNKFPALVSNQLTDGGPPVSALTVR